MTLGAILLTAAKSKGFALSPEKCYRGEYQYKAKQSANTHLCSFLEIFKQEFTTDKDTLKLT